MLTENPAHPGALNLAALCYYLDDKLEESVAFLKKGVPPAPPRLTKQLLHQLAQQD